LSLQRLRGSYDAARLLARETSPVITPREALLSAAQHLLGAFSTTMVRLGYLIDILGAH
jgi:hypothetical protein